MKKAWLPIILLVLSSCAKLSEEERAEKAQAYFRSAMANFKEKDYGDAAFDFEESLRYMDHLTREQIETAKYMIALSYYYDEDYVNAIVYLEDFIFYYPRHPKTEEAYYYLIDSYINVAPDPYRDQTYTWKAIKKAKEFLSKYGETKFRKKVNALIEKAYRKIAKHDYLIARFYEDYGYTYSAAVRYRELMLNYPQYIDQEEVAFRYLSSLLRIEEQSGREQEKISALLKEAREKLSSVKDPEEKRFILKRIKFLESEIKRWEKIKDDALKEAKESMEKFKEVYKNSRFLQQLEELSSKITWKN